MCTFKYKLSKNYNYTSLIKNNLKQQENKKIWTIKKINFNKL